MTEAERPAAKSLEAKSPVAKSPFHFVATAHLVRILPEHAWTLLELCHCLRELSDACIFHHTFQSVEQHHYTAFSNDFAQWALAACNERVLAEELAGVDLRDFVSIGEVRDALATVIENHLKRKPEAADRPGFEPFYFCESMEIVIPLGTCAHTLEELAEGIRQLSLETLHYHLISSRLRVQLRTNDFSRWIEDSLEMAPLADRLNRIDFYTNTLEAVRKEILRVLEVWIA